ncbi:MAG: S9 family peptidase [Rhodoferax sp.]|nr:S9 family peptidase [Rhodoferax sp.]
MKNDPAAAQPFGVDDIFLHHDISEVDGCPTQALVACTVKTLDRTNDATLSKLWGVPLDGSPPRPLTTGESSDSGARWSPDGRRLAFVSSRAGRNQVFVLPRDGGEALQLGQLDGSVESVRWSPDGQQLAVVCTLDVNPELRGQRAGQGDPLPPAQGPQLVWRLPYKSDGMGYTLAQENHLFTMDATSGDAQQLTDGPFDVRGVCWSPDGKQLAYVRTREGDSAHRTDLWLTDTKGRNARQLSTEQAQVLSPVWSPDGRWIVFSGTLDEGDAQVRLWCAEVATGTVQGLGSDAIEISTESDSVRFVDSDSREVLAVVARRGVHDIVALSVPHGHERRLLAGGQRQLLSLAHTREHLVFVVHSPVAATELHACRHDGSDERRLGRFNTWWDERAHAQLERRSFEVPDGEGGTLTIDGWLLRPPQAQGATPLLVEMHGGPASYVLFDYRPTAYWSLMCARGWSVLALHASGSASYGRAFAERLRGRWGELDLPQYLAAVDQLQSGGLVNEKIAAIGKSYGGFLAVWAIGHTERFGAAVVIAPVANLEAHYATSDSGYYADAFDMRGEREAQRAVYRRLSPTQYAARATTPTLILQGALDERCPRSQAEELFVTLKRGRNPPCELVLYPGASHKFTTSDKPSVQRDAVQRIADWLARWVPVHGQGKESGDSSTRQEERDA